jgi:hypothetical protein
MSTSGLVGVPLLEKGEVMPAGTVTPLVVAEAEWGTMNSTTERPSNPKPIRRSDFLRDHRALCTFRWPPIVGVVRRSGFPAA